MQSQSSIINTVRICALVSIGAMITTVASARDPLDMACQPYRPTMDFKREQIERPKAPLCVTLMIQFNEFTFNSCRAEMETYQKKVRAFEDCLVAEHERAIEEFNEAVQSFNSKSSQ